ncbi:hypothetical protein [Streptomyces sp. NPDC091268]|uniref:hypothetical protein n=1 Tax=Streptomyces sp. NPDC091268 TaxID=3365979 RepID=UPI003826463F
MSTVEKSPNAAAGSNSVTRAYLDRLGATRALAETVQSTCAGSALKAALGPQGFLTRPAFIEAKELAPLVTDLQCVLRLLRQLPQRLHGGDWDAYCQELRIPSALRELTGPEPPADRRFRVRADLLYDNTFRLLEFNFGSATGGAAAGELGRAMLEVPALSAFAEEHGLRHIHPVACLAPSLMAAAEELGVKQPVVALVEWPTSFRRAEATLRAWARALTRAGLDCRPCHIAQLDPRPNGLYLDRRKVDVAVRVFTLTDVLTAPEMAQPLVQATRHGQVVLYTGLDNAALDGKNTLALLSTADPRLQMNDREAQAVQRLLPWTRVVRAGRTQADGHHVDLVDYLHAHQKELVLKPALAHRGNGVRCGWSMTEHEWKNAVASALRHGATVAQRRVHPRPEAFPTEAGMQDTALVWGVYLTERGLAGLAVKGTPGTQPEVINYCNGARLGVVLHQPVEADNRSH